MVIIQGVPGVRRGLGYELGGEDLGIFGNLEVGETSQLHLRTPHVVAGGLGHPMHLLADIRWNVFPPGELLQDLNLAREPEKGLSKAVRDSTHLDAGERKSLLGALRSALGLRLVIPALELRFDEILERAELGLHMRNELAGGIVV